MPILAASPPAVAPLPEGVARGRRGERGRAVRVEADGAAYRVRRWECGGEPVLSCEAEPGSPLPAYAERRRLRERLRPPGAARRVLFTDAARLTGVWSWVEREEGGPLAYRERGWDGREPPAAPGRGERPGEGEASSERRTGSPTARRAARYALLALLRRSETAGLHPECADPGQLLQDTIERGADEEALRRVWRAASRLRVLDPACRSGEWLVGTAEAMAAVYLACLERMDAWVADAARGGSRSRRSRLRDFRAVLAAADDTRRWPSRRRYARELAVAQNLRGVAVDAAALAATTARLEGWARGGCAPGPGTPLARLLLRTGRVVAGEAGARRGGAGQVGGAYGAVDVAEVAEAAEAAHRAAAHLRRAWLTEGAGEAEVAAAALGIRTRLDGLAAVAAGAGRVVPWVEWRDVLARGGFHLVRGGGR